jgi:hypothetical protein
MSLQTKQRVVPVHPRTVVSDANEGNASPSSEDLDAGGMRVYRIFHQLFNYGSGPLDYLAGSDLTCNLLTEQTNSGHNAIMAAFRFWQIRNPTYPVK